MNIERRPDSLLRLSWSGGELRFNLVPMNSAAAPGAGFTARVRHTIAPARNEADLERLWTAFQTDLAAGRRYRFPAPTGLPPRR